MKDEKGNVKSGAQRGQLVFIALGSGGNAKVALGDKQAAGRYQNDGNHKGPKHDACEFTSWNIEGGVEIQILRVAKGREHAAEVSGDVLQDEDGGQILFAAGKGENEITQRQEGDQRHIVGNQHGADEGDIDQRQRCGARRAGENDDAVRQDGEKVDVFQRADDRQSNKQAAQRFEIIVFQILLIRRHDAGGERRQHKGDDEHSVFAQEGDNLLRKREEKQPLFDK